MPSPLLTKTAAFSQNTAATHEVVAAVAGKRIIVTGYELTSGGTNTVTWKSASTSLSGASDVAAGTRLGQPLTDGFYFATAAGEALNITLSGAQKLAGYVNYQVVE